MVMVSVLDRDVDIEVELGEPEDMTRAGLVGTIQGAIEMIRTKRRARALAKMAQRRAATKAAGMWYRRAAAKMAAVLLSTSTKRTTTCPRIRTGR